jgi:hypothetical protein
MENEKVFRTKTGFCHVTADRIVLTRDGIVGNVAKVVVGNTTSRILVIYGLLSAVLIYFGYDNYAKGEFLSSAFFGFLGLYLVYGIYSSLNNSATPIIERKDIKRVIFKKAIPGLTRSRFEVDFDENGKIKRRLILLPGSLSGGQDETPKAVQIMTEEKLLN